MAQAKHIRRWSYGRIFAIGLSLLGIAGGGAQAQTFPKAMLQKGQFIAAPQITYPVLDAQAEVIFEESFEEEIVGWLPLGDWSIGIPLAGPAACALGERCAGTGLGADYQNNANATLISPRITLEDTPGASYALRFDEWFALETGFDFGNTWVSTDDGQTWQEVGLFRTGTGDWRTTEVDLTPFAGQDIRLGFNLQTDESIVAAGWFIDEVMVVRVAEEGLAVSMSSLRGDRYPWVDLQVSIRTSGVPVQGLPSEAFTLFEDGERINEMAVVPPLVNAEERLVDVVFLADISASMEAHIGELREGVRDFARSLTNLNVDLALGLVTFRNTVNLLNQGALTRDVEAFASMLNGVTIAGGGDLLENAFGALSLSMQRIVFRPGSQRVFILVTDAPSHEGNENLTPPAPALEDLVALLQDRSITSYVAAVAHPQYLGENSITAETGGRFYTLDDGLSPLWQDVVGAAANTYVIRYRSSRSFEGGNARAVRLEVRDQGDLVQVEATYTPDPGSGISRTAETVALESVGQEPGQDLVIEAEIANSDVEEVRLVYRRNVGPLGFTSVEMQRLGGNRYRGIVPGSFLTTRHLQYFITVTTQAGTKAAPSQSFAHPYALTLLPNMPPEVRHQPIFTSPVGVDMEIGVFAKGETSALASVTYHQRNKGQIAYVQKAIPQVAPDSFALALPESARPAEGFEYYIYVEDERQVGRYAGHPDAPIQVEPGMEPDPTSLDAPEDGLRNVSIPAPLVWVPGSAAIRYDVGYATDSLFQDETVVWANEANLLLGGLEHYTTYYWRVRVISPGGRSGWSEVRQFTTHLAVPEIIYPLDVDLVPFQTIPLQWETVSGAETYAVQLATDATFASNLVANVVAQPTWSVEPVAPHVSHYWRIQARGTDGETSNWSTSFLFVPYTGSHVADRTGSDGASTEAFGKHGGGLPESYQLNAPYPNPFNTHVNIPYGLPEATDVSLRIFDVLGREVQTLNAGATQEAGWYRARWDGTDAAGNRVTHGLYLYRLEAGAYQEVGVVVKQ